MNQKKRKSQGSSLLELLIVVCLMSLVGAAITGLMLTQNAVGFRTFSKLTMLMSARRLQSSLEGRVHTARTIGNQIGPAYNIFGSGTNNYELNPQTLILQIPIYTTNGYPTTISTAPVNTGASWNVDTYVYKLIPDTNQPGKGRFSLTLQVFPGDHSVPNSLPIPAQSGNTQVIISNIVGPVNPADSIDPIAGTPTPKIFKYYKRNAPNWASTFTSQIETPNASETQQLNGVSVNIELFSNESSERKDMTPAAMAMRSEFFLRSNSVSL